MNNITLILLLNVLGIKYCYCGVDNNEIDHSIELTQSLNVAREEYLQRMCDYYDEENRQVELTQDTMDHILVDHTHKLLYCYVPKVACTNWKRVLMVLTGQWTGSDVLQIPASLAHSDGMFIRLGSLDSVTRNKTMAEYTRFIIVRHPFERLLSAYRNKLEGNSSSALYFQLRVGRTIIKKFRRNPSKESLLKGHDVTFTEFCMYLVDIHNKNSQTTGDLMDNHSKPSRFLSDTGIEFVHQANNSNHVNDKSKQTGNSNNAKQKFSTSEPIGDNKYSSSTPAPSSEFNEHWKPASNLCHPCAVKYNIIGKYETLQDDSRLVFSLIGAKNMTFPSSRPSMTGSHLFDHLKRMPIELLFKLYKVYEADFKLFGYSLEDLLGFELG